MVKTMEEVMQKIREGEDSNLVVKLFFEPHKDWEGSLRPLDVKLDLKQRNIKITKIEKETYWDKGSGKDITYYTLTIPYEYRHKVEEYVSNAVNIADIGFQRPRSNFPCTDKLKVD